MYNNSGQIPNTFNGRLSTTNDHRLSRHNFILVSHITGSTVLHHHLRLRQVRRLYTTRVALNNIRRKAGHTFATINRKRRRVFNIQRRPRRSHTGNLANLFYHRTPFRKVQHSRRFRDFSFVRCRPQAGARGAVCVGITARIVIEPAGSSGNALFVHSPAIVFVTYTIA